MRAHVCASEGQLVEQLRGLPMPVREAGMRMPEELRDEHASGLAATLAAGEAANAARNPRFGRVKA